MTQKNYTELPQLYDQYSKQGLKILAFPCNQFSGQEPGTHEEILEFVRKFDPDMDKKLEFYEKGDVNGAMTREVYSFLKKATDGQDIRWNFTKFLVYKDNIKNYGPKTRPFDLKGDIEELLKQKAADSAQ